MTWNPNTGRYSTPTPAAPQDAPKLPNVLAIHPNALSVAFEGRSVLTPPAEILETGKPLPEYISKDLSDARIAELEAVADFHGSLLGDAAQKLREACDAHAVLSQYDKVDEMHNLADEIDKALKTPEGDA